LIINYLVLNTLFLSNNNFSGNYANLITELPNIETFEIDEANTKGVLATFDEEVDDN